MNILAYVHLRNIHGSTGHGRFARQVIEHLAKVAEDQVHILADALDHGKVVHKVGAPWTKFSYHFFDHDTSRQQARWALTGNPGAEDYWPEAQIVYCGGESYVPARKARLVVTLFDVALFERDVHRESWWLFKQRIKKRYLCYILSRKADIVHTISDFSAERIAHFFPELSGRLRVVPCGVSPRFFLPVSMEGESFLRQMEMAERPFILLPGGLSHRKNAELVLQAWPLIRDRYPDVVLVVAGHCDSSYAAGASSLADSVILTGFVSDDALCSLYHKAQAVWFPSLYEGFGLPVLEAMACGAPVVASSSTSIPEIAGNAAVLVSPASSEEHVEAFDLVLEDTRLRQSLVDRGKTRAHEFTWQRTALQLRRHFVSLA